MAIEQKAEGFYLHLVHIRGVCYDARKYQKHTAYYYFYFTEDPDNEFTLLKSILLPKANKETTCRPLLKACTFGIVSSSGATAYIDLVALSTLSPPTAVGNTSFLEPYVVRAVTRKLR